MNENLEIKKTRRVLASCEVAFHIEKYTFNPTLDAWISLN